MVVRGVRAAGSGRETFIFFFCWKHKRDPPPPTSYPRYYDDFSPNRPANAWFFLPCCDRSLCTKQILPFFLLDTTFFSLHRGFSIPSLARPDQSPLKRRFLTPCCFLFFFLPFLNPLSNDHCHPLFAFFFFRAFSHTSTLRYLLVLSRDLLKDYPAHYSALKDCLSFPMNLASTTSPLGPAHFFPWNFPVRDWILPSP